MDSRLFSRWRFTKDKLSIVVTEFTNVFGDSDVRWGITATTKNTSTWRQMKWVLCRREICPRTNGNPSQKYPKQTSIPKLIGLFFSSRTVYGPVDD